MIVRTRYRDIPFSEAVKCARVIGPEDRIHWERDMRGKPVHIVTPPLPYNSNERIKCGSALYAVADSPLLAVCPHIAEIGD